MPTKHGRLTKADRLGYLAALTLEKETRETVTALLMAKRVEKVLERGQVVEKIRGADLAERLRCYELELVASGYRAKAEGTAQGDERFIKCFKAALHAVSLQASLDGLGREDVLTDEKRARLEELRARLMADPALAARLKLGENGKKPLESGLIEAKAEKNEGD